MQGILLFDLGLKSKIGFALSLGCQRFLQVVLCPIEVFKFHGAASCHPIGAGFLPAGPAAVLKSVDGQLRLQVGFAEGVRSVKLLCSA